MIRSGAPMLLVALSVLTAACGPARPTPYQPFSEPAGGYEQTRLQEDMFRVSFRGNRHTPEADVIDYVYLRCAELTLDAGYTHFSVVERFGRTGVRGYAYAGPMMGSVGMYSGRRDPFWGFHGAYGYPPGGYVAELDHHLAMFVIRLHEGPGESGDPPRLDAKFLLQSLEPKRRRSQATDGDA